MSSCALHAPISMYLYNALPHSPYFRSLSYSLYDQAQNIIYAHLRTFDIDDCPPYFALSYTWNSPIVELDNDEWDHSIYCGVKICIRDDFSCDDDVQENFLESSG
jgi:hypothetical protein